MFSDFEENFGLTSHSILIIEQAILKVTEVDLKFELFNLLLAKTTLYFGIMKTREVF